MPREILKTKKVKSAQISGTFLRMNSAVDLSKSGSVEKNMTKMTDIADNLMKKKGLLNFESKLGKDLQDTT